MAEHTPTPWRYRPNHYDDWGWIKGPDGRLTATARSSGEYDGDEHRAAGTDPYEANAAFIVKCVNSHDALVKALENICGAAEHCGDEDAPVVVAARAVLARVGQQREGS